MYSSLPYLERYWRNGWLSLGNCCCCSRPTFQGERVSLPSILLNCTLSTFSWDFTVTLSNSTTSTLFLLLLKVMFLHIHDTKQTTLWITLSNNVGWQTGGSPIQGRVTFLSRRLLVEPSLVLFRSCSSWSSCFVCLQNYANLFILNLETSTENKNTSWRVLHLSSGKFGKRERPFYPVLILPHALTPWPAHLFVVLRGAFQAVTANLS